MCAQEALIQLGLERVVWIPARLPPHKPVDDDPGIEHRLELCRLAIDGDERFAVSELEPGAMGRLTRSIPLRSCTARCQIASCS